MQVVLEREVVQIHHGTHAFGKAFRIEQVGDTNAAASDLVFVSRADAAACGTDLVGAERGFARVIQRHVVRHDQGGVARDANARFSIHSVALEFFDFREEGFGRKHDTVAEIAARGRMHDARRDQTQNRFCAVDHEGVTGIVTAVEANDAVDALGEPVDNLALAFVTPLGTDYHDIFRHWDSFHPEFRGP